MNRRQTTQLLGAAALATLAAPLAAAGSSTRPWRYHPAVSTAVSAHLDQFADRLQIGLQDHPHMTAIVKREVHPVQILQADLTNDEYHFRYRNRANRMITLSNRQGKQQIYIHT